MIGRLLRFRGPRRSTILVIGCLASMALLISCATKAHALIIDPTIDPFSIAVSPESPTSSDAISINALRLCAFVTSGYWVESIVTLEDNQILLNILSFSPAPERAVFPATQDLHASALLDPLAPGSYEVFATWFLDGVERESTSLSFTVVPEPSSWLLLSLGIAGMVMIRRKLASRA